ncbi:B3 domain-containing protein-like protein [Salvia divinorum]|uniref:B3 domain-containing protein-like protein n=1 Tax=Salvia divinorum TaxID=28513 RepID=A0ABD1I699_SALDI
MAQPPQPVGDGDDDVPYPRKPAFLKFFSMERNADNIRVPPAFVAMHGDELTYDCRLVMPNGRSWSVLLLNIASGCHFRTGWAEFVCSNDIQHGDTLVFTLVGRGIFEVKRFSVGGMCPPRRDLRIPSDGDESDEPVSPDVDTSDDYEPSSEGDTDTDHDYESNHDALEDDDHPMFTVVLSNSHIRRTLEIPILFWRKHIRMSALKDEIYFTVDSTTWLIEVDHNEHKMWIKKGWKRFKNGNGLVEGVRCIFQLVDVKEVHFYITFAR